MTNNRKRRCSAHKKHDRAKSELWGIISVVHNAYDYARSPAVVESQLARRLQCPPQRSGLQA
eukprot:scaffold11567_cov31-Tisochrysis_lutea.AAC.3